MQPILRYTIAFILVQYQPTSVLFVATVIQFHATNFTIYNCFYTCAISTYICSIRCHCDSVSCNQLYDIQLLLYLDSEVSLESSFGPRMLHAAKAILFDHNSFIAEATTLQTWLSIMLESTDGLI